uniref:ribose-phosphate diphosphokinase n=1 Tax=Dugesia ryukyuensis TaxID=79738 RepID=A7M6E2_DUGRY|nr:ribose-phosphate pyrophosphokinase I [Dugesia ryukyuensis]
MLNIRLFSGSSNILLTEKIGERIGIKLSEAILNKFSNNETSVQIKESVRGKDVFILQSGYIDVNNHLMELLIMINACKNASSARITAVLPYMPYSRQSKKDNNRVPITAKLVADLLHIAGANHIITMDLHASQIQGFFNVPVDNLLSESCHISWIKKNISKWEEITIFSLNVTSAERVANMANTLKVRFGLIYVEKKEASEQIILVGDVVSRIAVILLDIIDNCDLVISSVKRLKEVGAAGVYVIATHGMLSERLMKEVDDSIITKLVVTNTICQEKYVKQSDKIACLDVSVIFAEAIRRIHYGESVSCLYNNLLA